MSGLRIIFLDIDGVLNSLAWYAEKKDSERPIDELDPAAVARLQKLVDATHAQIVISSTWRLLYKRNRLADMLAARGLRARVISVTPCLPQSERGNEIALWLQRTSDVVDGIVIFDDDRNMVHLTPWLVRTSFAVGLTDADVEAAREIIMRAPPARAALLGEPATRPEMKHEAVLARTDESAEIIGPPGSSAKADGR